jgi:hypothetical protein
MLVDVIDGLCIAGASKVTLVTVTFDRDNVTFDRYVRYV